MQLSQLGSSGQTIVDVDGAEKITTILMTLVNEYPGLAEGNSISFGELTETAGIGFFSSSGAVLIEHRRDILGHVYQLCSYPFEIVYRASPKSEEMRVKIKEFLDGLGRWLEQQPVKIGDTVYILESYPEIQLGNRVIKEIRRSAPGHQQGVYADGIEDWAISLQLSYENYY